MVVESGFEPAKKLVHTDDAAQSALSSYRSLLPARLMEPGSVGLTLTSTMNYDLTLK